MKTPKAYYECSGNRCMRYYRPTALFWCELGKGWYCRGCYPALTLIGPSLAEHLQNLCETEKSPPASEDSGQGSLNRRWGDE